METIAISKFKATCLELLRRIKATGQPLLVTRQGEPLAMVLPPPAPTKTEKWLGCLAHTGNINDSLTTTITASMWNEQ